MAARTPAAKAATPEPNEVQVTSPAAAEPVVHESLAEALSAFQMELPTVRKGNQADIPGKEGRSGFKYSYADLTDVSEVGLPLLGKHGLAWHTGLDTREDGQVVITWRLMHGKSGTELNGSIPVGRPGADWRQMGSAITYARRYALTAATGIAPGGDDDDAAASVPAGAPADRPAQRPAPSQAPIQQPPRQNLPEGLYDLAGITTRAKAEEVYQAARKVPGHLTMLVAEQDPETGEQVPIEFGAWLIKTGKALAEIEAQDPAAAAEAAEQAAIAAHEAEQASDDAQA